MIWPDDVYRASLNKLIAETELELSVQPGDKNLLLILDYLRIKLRNIKKEPASVGIKNHLNNMDLNDMLTKGYVEFPIISRNDWEPGAIVEKSGIRVRLIKHGDDSWYGKTYDEHDREYSIMDTDPGWYLVHTVNPRFKVGDVIRSKTPGLGAGIKYKIIRIDKDVDYELEAMNGSGWKGSCPIEYVDSRYDKVTP